MSFRIIYFLYRKSKRKTILFVYNTIISISSLSLSPSRAHLEWNTTYRFHPDYLHRKNILLSPLRGWHRGIDIFRYGDGNARDVRYMALHQQWIWLDFPWFHRISYQNAKETLDRVSRGILSQFSRVDSCALFWFWCYEFSEEFFSIYTFPIPIFFHSDFELCIFSRTLACLHRESDEIISRFEWCSEFGLYFCCSDVVDCDSCHESIIYDYTENQILFSRCP